ncbi:xanthine dehydrogenase accessory protein XdhC [Usitatibacter palustris]|uniref:PH domain-containing protein n=1 Tax=Usitatibacter palustris TaxID=2732487 RepID=A0A6M4HA54_9PROT|nr:xanthine dehydrogenase accessory protein XdhC [Usitatibacter palustris]QJR15274.1 hypothetical protein DSM104440_02091 [Usitatibacter palustris]
MRDWLQALHDALDRDHGPVVRVTVATVRGSAPREAGAAMLVMTHGEAGSIGGGHLELVATRTAHDLLAAAPGAARLDRFPLGAALGQCCGGIVELWFQRYDGDDLAAIRQLIAARTAGAEVLATPMTANAGASRSLPRSQAQHEGVELHERAQVVAGSGGDTLYERLDVEETQLWLFGAGHVGRALVNVLAPLPFRITWVDSREGQWPEALPDSVRSLHAIEPADEVTDMPADAWALVMTHSHDEDLAICEALLRDGRFAWAGVIGSQPKTTRFRQRLAQRGFAPEAVARLTMPIGIGGIASKEPAAIAVAVAAQLLQLRDARAAAEDLPIRKASRS